ncbi:MAG TPA: thrombospondin type 3 repeat-containing protein, partial [Phycisphaerae bacterium]|nr:thrombospondin type 3 repeat-containing protein [Phycisphaerae bacterium]HRR86273.1 thrombospondin type 3 repeat-containing protein [Phycisphaerae bacterium]
MVCFVEQEVPYVLRIFDGARLAALAFVCLAGACLPRPILADIFVRWQDPQANAWVLAPSAEATIDQANRRITFITPVASRVYWVYAGSGIVPQGEPACAGFSPEDIVEICGDSTTVSFSVQIVAPFQGPNGPVPRFGCDGAANVNAISLSNTNARIAASRISGNCGSIQLKTGQSGSIGRVDLNIAGSLTRDIDGDGYIDVDRPSSFSSLGTSGLIIGGSIANGISLTITGPTGGSLSVAGDIDGNVTINSFSSTGNICAANISGLSSESQLPPNIDIGPDGGGWKVCGQDLECDTDGVPDGADNCKCANNPDQTDTDGDGVGDVCDTCTDTDGDGKGNPGFPANTCPADNCPDVSNPGQQDTDGDQVGDACDNCPTISNTTQVNSDHDALGDSCDNCPTVYNPDQTDTDGDDLGNACDPDDDGDDIADAIDNCPLISNSTQTDTDGDGVGDACDNCLNVLNPDQRDTDRDGIGDVCENVIYVKPQATGLGDGTSWENATTLQAALTAAQEHDDIWVAAGTYKPSSPSGRAATFQLQNDVSVYGGFAGIAAETPATFNLADRDFTTNQTVLSGDIGTVGTQTDNCYHVVTGSGTNSTAILDGFTIRDGNANGSATSQKRGGGLYLAAGSPAIVN